VSTLFRAFSGTQMSLIITENCRTEI